jgi:hypothetical protein
VRARRALERGAAAAALALAAAAVGGTVASNLGGDLGALAAADRSGVAGRAAGGALQAPPRRLPGRAGGPAEAPPQPLSDPDPSPAGRAAFPSAGGFRAARTYADGRRGMVTWAVVDTRGRLSGQRSGTDFPSASLVKAMLLVAFLDRPDRRERPLERWERGVLGPMVRWSDNDAAARAFAEVGDAGLARLARRARMRRFGSWGYWSSAHTNAADQARFFRRLPQLVPERHRPYARRLLAGIVPGQRWGVPPAARGWRVYFKGGWRPSASGRLVHQAALLERGPRRLSLVVLTDGSPSHHYGAETIRGVAARVLDEAGGG